MVLGGAVRGGTKALQRLTAQERLQDLRVASQHLEATASGGNPMPSIMCGFDCLHQPAFCSRRSTQVTPLPSCRTVSIETFHHVILLQIVGCRAAR